MPILHSLSSIHTCQEILTAVELTTVTLRDGATLGAVNRISPSPLHIFFQYAHRCAPGHCSWGEGATEQLWKPTNRQLDGNHVWHFTQEGGEKII